MQINLNADLGEGFGPWVMGDDAAMLAIVKSANIACGAHAGDPNVMRSTLHAARTNGVSVGAHPSFPDLQGFGRRIVPLSTAELENQIAFQIGALAGVAALEGLAVTHVKPHGALSNIACADRCVADTICRAVRAVNCDLLMLVPATSQLVAAGRSAGMRVVEEIFADRAYRPNGELVPRSHPGAVLREPSQCVSHVLAMLDAGAIIAQDGTRLPTDIGSICVHGDTADAVAIAAAVRQAVAEAGHRLLTLPEL